MWAKLSETKEGDTLIADGGFTCMKAGPHVVQMGDDGVLNIACDEGRHRLDGQTDDGEHMVGLTRPQ